MQVQPADDAALVSGASGDRLALPGGAGGSTPCGVERAPVGLGGRIARFGVGVSESCES
jgi:hypothetical protein